MLYRQSLAKTETRVSIATIMLATVHQILFVGSVLLGIAM